MGMHILKTCVNQISKFIHGINKHLFCLTDVASLKKLTLQYGGQFSKNQIPQKSDSTLFWLS